MKQYKVKINQITDVKKASEATRSCNGEVFAEDGTYKVNGKSILGLFSLNLCNDITFTFIENADADLFVANVPKEIFVGKK